MTKETFETAYKLDRKIKNCKNAIDSLNKVNDVWISIPGKEGTDSIYLPEEDEGAFKKMLIDYFTTELNFVNREFKELR